MSNNDMFYRCYSRKLNEFLKAMGVKAVGQGAHVTGVQISQNEGITWDDFTNIHQARDAYPAYTLDEIAEARDKAFSHREIVEDESNGILFRHRVRIFNVYEQDDKLSTALKQWSATKPK